MSVLLRRRPACPTTADNSVIDRLVREGFVDQVYKKRLKPSR
jgi:hypothetical protein